MKKMALLPGLLFAVGLHAQMASNEAATGSPPATASVAHHSTPGPSERAAKLAALEAGVFQKRYGCDNGMAGAVKDLYVQRETLLDELLAQDPGAAAANGRLLSGVARYDSLIEQYAAAAEGMAYLNEKMALMEKVKPLTYVQKNDLRNFYMVFCIKNGRGFPGSFEEAMHKSILDTAYYAELYRDEINLNAKNSAATEMQDMMRKNNLTQDGMRKLFPLVIERDKKLALVDFALPMQTIQKDTLNQKIHRQYDALIDVSLKRDGSAIPSSQFAIAIKFRKTLDITDAQVDSLLAKAAILKQMKTDFQEKDPFGKFDSKVFEADNMQKIVSEDQYSKVLMIKNRSEAETNAEMDWQELEQRAMSARYNKDSTLVELKNYYLAKLCTYYRYANDKLKQSVNVKNLQEHMPAALRALTSARKYNNSVDSTAGANYHW